MARYIDADKLYDAVEGVYKYAKGGERIVAKVFLAMICDAPTADMVEVVRCKDCALSRPLNKKDPFESIYCDECVVFHEG